jgi:hypothetical protein
MNLALAALLMPICHPRLDLVSALLDSTPILMKNYVHLAMPRVLPVQELIAINV